MMTPELGLKVVLSGLILLFAAGAITAMVDRWYGALLIGPIVVVAGLLLLVWS